MPYYPSNRDPLLALLLVLLIATLGACGQTPSGVSSPAAAQATNAPIKVGCSLPQTGPSAETGVWVKRGYEQWAADVNARGGLLGRPVELLIYDDESKVDNAVNLLNRLISAERVDLVCGGYPGTAVAAQMTVAEKNQKVYVSMGGHMASFQQNYSYSFGAPPLMGQWWYEGLFAWLETVPAVERPKKAAIFTMNNPIGSAILDPIPERLGTLGIEVAINEKYDIPLADATPLVAKAKAAGAEMFFSNGLLADGVQTVRAMKALGYNPALFVQGIGSLVPAWTKELGPDANYVFSGTALHDKLPFEGIDRLNQVAKEKHNVPTAPTYFLFGYAWLQALQQGVEGAGSLDQTAIRDWLKSHEISTIAGKLSFDQRGLPKPYNYLTQVIDGRVELIWPKGVRTHEPVYPKPEWGT